MQIGQQLGQAIANWRRRPSEIGLDAGSNSAAFQLYQPEHYESIVESAQMKIDDTFGFLLGNWTLTRWIEDRQTGLSSRFTGTAMLSETSHGYGWYREVGELCYGDYTGPANRTLQMLRRADSSVVVQFSDGRPYVEVDLSSANWSGHHLCGRDTYEIEIHAQSQEVILEKWRVLGPSKNYDALALMRRE